QALRFAPKNFGQRRPDGNGGWIWNMKGVGKVPYHLPEIVKAKTVFVVEGEKDADNLRAIGLTATCNVGGAGKWLEEYSARFSPHQSVVVIPDNDEPGKNHAHKVAASLYGRVASLKILELSDLPPKGDVSDWLVKGHGREELLRLAKKVTE